MVLLCPFAPSPLVSPTPPSPHPSTSCYHTTLPQDEVWVYDNLQAVYLRGAVCQIDESRTMDDILCVRFADADTGSEEWKAPGFKSNSFLCSTHRPCWRPRGPKLSSRKLGTAKLDLVNPCGPCGPAAHPQFPQQQTLYGCLKHASGRGGVVLKKRLV